MDIVSTNWQVKIGKKSFHFIMNPPKCSVFTDSDYQVLTCCLAWLGSTKGECKILQDFTLLLIYVVQFLTVNLFGSGIVGHKILSHW